LGLLLCLVQPLSASDNEDPFVTRNKPAVIQTETELNPKPDAESPFSSRRSEVAKREPFQDSPETSPKPEAISCGADSSLAFAKLRKPVMAELLCEKRYKELDSEWLFVLYYVRGFNEYLQDKAAFKDPTGACARAAEPRRGLNLIYTVIDTLLGRGDKVDENADVKKWLEPYLKDWTRLPFLLKELRAWSKEGELDAASVASVGMCDDPAFKLFWGSALEYAKKLPGTHRNEVAPPENTENQYSIDDMVTALSKRMLSWELDLIEFDIPPDQAAALAEQLTYRLRPALKNTLQEELRP
jgi:hypothetical protein